MSTVHFKVDDTLRRHNKTPAALIKASGLAKTTVYNIVNNKAKAVELATLSKLMVGLRELTDEEVAITDILEEESKPDWREEILKNAKPIGLEALQKLIPDWTAEEKAHNERVWAELEADKRTQAAKGSARLREIEQLFQPEPGSNTPDNDPDNNVAKVQ